MTDQRNHRVTDRDFTGKYRIVYFGYTFCPDVCPTDVQHIAAAMKLLDTRDPGLAKRIVPIFITVDPERDTPAVLRQFAEAFDPRIVGLTGSAAEIAGVAKSYGIYYRHGTPTANGGYVVDHSRQSYLMAPDGKPLALLPQEQGPDAIVGEIERWAS